MKLYEKIHKFSSVISYFCLKHWQFDDGNVEDLWNSISEKDREVFFFDIKQMKWSQYFHDYIKGMRQYLMHDSLDTLPVSLIRWRRLVFMVVATPCQKVPCPLPPL